MAKTTESRTQRDLETRETEARPAAYAPPQLLPEVKAVDGWKFRWIRASLLGEIDKMNTSVRFREGWEPCSPSEHPELQLDSESNPKFKGLVEVGGLILCKSPAEKTEARQAYYEKAAQQQLESVDNNFMKENDPRMPLFSERRSKVSFGKG